MSTLICSFDGLHDNRVLRYYADFEAHILHMDTQTEAGEKVSVHFTGLLAHWFENVVQDNILFGMDEISVDAFFEQYKDLLVRVSTYSAYFVELSTILQNDIINRIEMESL